MKICTGKRCKIKTPQADDQFRRGDGGETNTCLTCRENQRDWKKKQEPKPDRIIPTPVTVNQYYAGLVVRATSRPQWLAELINNG